MRKQIFTLAATASLAVGLAGCAHARARTPADTPPLAVPAPPPRLVEPDEVQAPTPVPLPGEPAHHELAPGETPARREPPHPEKAEAPKVEPPAESKPVEEPPRPATTLQTTPTDAEGQVEQAIRGLLTRAGNDLNHIDYRALNTDARQQYDTAKRFIAQAEQALEAKNLVFAKNLADKAAALAAQLAGK